MSATLKRLRQLIIGNISIKEFFTSSRFRQHLDILTKLVSQRYGSFQLQVKPTWDSKKDDIACTDNRLIYINLDNPLAQKTTDIEDRYRVIVGLLGHELGHVLYTNFDDIKFAQNAFINKQWFPYRPQFQDDRGNALLQVAEKRLFGNKALLAALLPFYADILNSVEDGYVNVAICKEFSGSFKEGILYSHKLMLDEFSVQVKNGHELTALRNLVLIASLQYFDMLKPEHFKVFPTLSRIVGLARTIPNLHQYQERMDVTNKIMVLMWDYIEQQLQAAESAQKNQQGNSDGQSGQGSDGCQSGQNSQGSQGGQSDNDQNQDGQNGSNDQNNGQNDQNGQNGSNSQGSQGNQNGQSSRNGQQGGQQSGRNDNNNGNSQNGQGGQTLADVLNQLKDATQNKPTTSQEGTGTGLLNQNNGSDNQSSSLGDKKSNESENNDSGKDASNANGDKSDASSSESKGSKNEDGKSQKGEKGSESDSGRPNRPENMTGNDESSLEESIKSLLLGYADEKMRKNPECIDNLERKAVCKDISSDAMHRGVKANVSVPRENKSGYDSFAGPLKGYSRRLQKDVSEAIRDRKEGTTERGLLYGSRINPGSAAARDGKIFKKNRLPDDEPDLAVSLLLDESGSMSGKRIESARNMAAIIEDFCRGLDIPVSIVGHYENGYSVEINQYVDYNDSSASRKHRLAAIQSHGCNRDGYALKYCIRRLEQRDEPMKLMILVSDGQPNAHNYGGNDAIQELKGVKDYCDKKGIALFAAAIGDDKDVIRGIYGNSFLDITDLSQLSRKMVQLVKKFL